MHNSKYARSRSACAYFYLGLGLAYGLEVGRLPALQEQVGASIAQLGVILFCSGFSSFIALLCAGLLIARWGSKFFLVAGSALVLFAVCLIGLTWRPWQFGALCLLSGLGMGLADVAANTQSIQIEQRFKKKSMSFMHAAYSLGTVLGAVLASVFASFAISPFVNFLSSLGCYLCFFPLAARHLLHERGTGMGSDARRGGGTFAPILLIFGVCALIVYAAEGSVADWGAILLYTVKGASQSVSALVYVFFGTCTVICRLFGDYLREVVGDLRLAIAGAALACLGLGIALKAGSTAGCFAGYALMGAGLAPVAPIMFSMAGTLPGISPARASAYVSLLAYSGLLCFPPGIGFLAEHFGLERALFCVLAACLLLVALLAFLMRSGTLPRPRSACGRR